jgi:hypothetical protein
MKPFLITATILGSLLLAGCQNKHAATVSLQQQYEQAHKQYIDDCVTPMTSGAGNALSGKTQPSPTAQQQTAQQQKCEQEAKRAGDIQRQLLAASH